MSVLDILGNSGVKLENNNFEISALLSDTYAPLNTK
jgi:hypothetical protein